MNPETQRSEQDIKEAYYRELRAKAPGIAYSELEQLVLAARMLAAEGHWANGIAGQITARAEAPGTYYTLKFGIGADEATPDGFMVTNDALQALDGRSLPNPATRFHTWVYRANPEVNCIIHTHPPAVQTLAMIGQPLIVANMDACVFHDNCSYLEEWPGLPIADEEGRIISQALAGRKALLLAHHGLLTAGTSIAEAATLAIWMEQQAANQLRASAAGTIRPVPDHLASEARDFLLKPQVIDMAFLYFARRVLRDDPDCLAADRQPA